MALLLPLGLALHGGADQASDKEMYDCTLQLKNLGIAVELYAADHKGQVPTRLDALLPDYLKVMPTCPSAHRDTYTPTYHTSGPGQYQFCCGGHFHAASGVAANQPGYNSRDGLYPADVAARVQQIESTLPDRPDIACKSHLTDLASALEMYAVDHAGHYPVELKRLVPDYLKALPTCVDHLGYQKGYQMGSNPDRFLLCCPGHNHKREGYPPNRPAYDSERGLLDK